MSSLWDTPQGAQWPHSPLRWVFFLAWINQIYSQVWTSAGCSGLSLIDSIGSNPIRSMIRKDFGVAFRSTVWKELKGESGGRWFRKHVRVCQLLFENALRLHSSHAWPWRLERVGREFLRAQSRLLLKRRFSLKSGFGSTSVSATNNVCGKTRWIRRYSQSRLGAVSEPWIYWWLSLIWP